MTMLRGVDGKWLIDLTPYAVQRYTIGGRVNPINVSNTEGITGNPDVDVDASPGFAAKLPDLKEGNIRLVNATFDDTANPWAAPLALGIGDWVEVAFYPDGVLASSHYHFGNCLIVSFSHEGSVPGPQPITLELETDGEFLLNYITPP